MEDNLPHDIHLTLFSVRLLPTARRRIRCRYVPPPLSRPPKRLLEQGKLGRMDAARMMLEVIY